MSKTIKGQLGDGVDAVLFQLFKAMNIKGLRADVELVASAERIARGDGHPGFLSEGSAALYHN